MTYCENTHMYIHIDMNTFDLSDKVRVWYFKLVSKS